MALDQDPAPGLGSSECHGRPRTFFFPGGEGAKTMSKERVFFFHRRFHRCFTIRVRRHRLVFARFAYRPTVCRVLGVPDSVNVKLVPLSRKWLSLDKTMTVAKWCSFPAPKAHARATMIF